MLQCSEVGPFFAAISRLAPAVLLGPGGARDTVNSPCRSTGLGPERDARDVGVLAARRTRLRRSIRLNGDRLGGQVTFKQYIFAVRTGPNARGDFIRDARDDAKMPDDFESADQLVSYLRRQHFACAGAIEGARAAWRTFRAAKRRAA